MTNATVYKKFIQFVSVIILVVVCFVEMLLYTNKAYAQDTPVGACFKWIQWNWSAGPDTMLTDFDTSAPGGEVYMTSSNQVEGYVGDQFVQYQSVGDNINYYGKLHVHELLNIFPPEFNVPTSSTISNSRFIMNRLNTTNTLQFSEPTPNPILVFDSVGSSSKAVSVVFPGKEIEILFGKRLYTWGAGNLCEDTREVQIDPNNPPDPQTYYIDDGVPEYNRTNEDCVVVLVDQSDPDKKVGFATREGFFIVKVLGEHSSVSFSYSAEFMVQFVFGYDPTECGNGSLECGEECDLGNKNGVPGLGCSKLCKSTGGFECSGPDNFNSYINDYDALIEDYKNCFTSITPTPAGNANCDSVPYDDFYMLKSKSIYVMAINDSCPGEGFYGQYENLRLNGQDIILKCTKDNIKENDRQVIGKISSSYKTLNDTGCVAASSDTITNLDLDGEVKSCQFYCDDNIDCKFVVETGVIGARKCKIYKTCSEASGTTGAILYKRI